MGSSQLRTANAITATAVYEHFNRRDFDAAADLCAEDCIFQDVAQGTTVHGRNGVKEFLQQWTSAFSDARVGDIRVVDAGDAVIVRFRGEGTNDGKFGPLPATGRQVGVQFCDVVHFDDSGLIVATETYYDRLSFLEQLGHAP